MNKDLLTKAIDGIPQFAALFTLEVVPPWLEHDARVEKGMSVLKKRDRFGYYIIGVGYFDLSVRHLKFTGKYVRVEHDVNDGYIRVILEEEYTPPVPA